jgi:hypothetical protein
MVEVKPKVETEVKPRAEVKVVPVPLANSNAVANANANANANAVANANADGGANAQVCTGYKPLTPGANPMRHANGWQFSIVVTTSCHLPQIECVVGCHTYVYSMPADISATTEFEAVCHLVMSHYTH